MSAIGALHEVTRAPAKHWGAQVAAFLLAKVREHGELQPIEVGEFLAGAIDRG
jgi:hypothetical protein